MNSLKNESNIEVVLYKCPAYIKEINKPEIEPVGLASGGIVTSPTNALIGEGGEPEAVIPLSKLSTMVGGNNSTQSNTNKNIETLLTKLLAAVEKGGDVYMDGNKVGRSLALATSNMG